VKGALLVCGTTSDAGKSTVVTGLCRLLARQGVSVAPFKGQNMSLNSMVTADGGEIGRAQWLQAIAAGATPEVAMNPVLLKPTGDRDAHVVVMGRPTSLLPAADYQRAKSRLVEIVDGALADLRSRYDVVVCEGAGSPAEINLLQDDLVNLGLAERAGLPALLVGDIERGGVFAHLYGTVTLLPPALAGRVRGFVINRFRGDPSLLSPAPADLETRTGIPTLGVLPHLGHLALDAEDSLALDRPSRPTPPGAALIDVAAIRFPRLSNFTDLDPLANEPGVRVRWVDGPTGLGRPHLVVLGGTRATVADLEWLRASGLADALAALRASVHPPLVLGICGGFQMLGERVDDGAAVESSVPLSVAGLGRLPVHTVFAPDKVTRLTEARDLEGQRVCGYEIRHGEVFPDPGWQPWLETGPQPRDAVLSARDPAGDALGTTLHGLFEEDGFRRAFLTRLASRASVDWRPTGVSYAAAREQQIDRIADACEAHLDLDGLWRLVASGRLVEER
jgi:adenosylcobyric acid synthase